MVEWMVLMGPDQTLTTAQEAPTEAIQTFVDPVVLSTGNTMLMTKEVTVAIVTKQFIKATLPKNKPFQKLCLVLVLIRRSKYIQVDTHRCLILFHPLGS